MLPYLAGGSATAIANAQAQAAAAQKAVADAQASATAIANGEHLLIHAVYLRAVDQLCLLDVLIAGQGV